MNMRFIIMLSMALLLALGAATISRKWLTSAAKTDKTIPVVVAAVEIPDDIMLEDSHLKEIAWPEGLAPEGVFASKDLVIGRVTTSKLFPGELVTNKRTSENGSTTLSGRITQEFRALSVRVDDVVGVAGFILPGNNVDILTTKMDRTVNEANTTTLLQNIKVLAVDQEASPEKDKPAIVKAVTLELKPKQAEIVVKAMQEGTIQLTLRNPQDNFVRESAVEEPPPEPTQSPNKISAKKMVRRAVSW
jgi:pilus assembly protein CpaB